MPNNAGGREFYSVLWVLAVPVAVQNLVSAALNMVDTVMIGQLGSTELAAVGLANQFYFLMVLLLFGLYSGAAIFTAQYWGQEDIVNIRRVLGVSVVAGGLAAALFTLGGIVFPERVLGLFIREQHVIRLGSQYLRIVALSYVMTSVSFAYGFLSRTVRQAKLPMYVSAGSLALNTLLNYLLIFGKFGFPAMGVAGAALATALARLVEMVILLALIYRREHVLAARLREMLDFTLPFVRRFFKTSMSVILNEFVWALGMVACIAAYARMGENALAAIQMVTPVQHLSLVLFIGIANACAVMLGNQIGANEEETAFCYAKKFAAMGPVLAFFISTVLILFSGRLVAAYNVPPAVKEAAGRVLVVFAGFLLLKVFNLINIIGILRSGGDTRFTFLLDSGGTWLIGVPMAFWGGVVWKLPLHWVVALVSLEEIVKAVIGLKRMYSRKWIRNIISVGNADEFLPT